MKKRHEEWFQMFRELQERHAKRNRKLLDLILNAESAADFDILTMLVNEEIMKRKEDQDRLYPMPEGTRGKAAEVMLYEITDPTVVYFLKQKVERLREMHDIKPITDDEPE
jgi:hypothetical protein